MSVLQQGIALHSPHQSILYLGKVNIIEDNKAIAFVQQKFRILSRFWGAQNDEECNEKD